VTIATIRIEQGGGELAAGARSSFYRLLADSFSYPSDGLPEGLATGGWSSQFRELAPHLPFEFPAAEPSFADANADALRQAYVSVFEVGTGRPYCPLYEGSHRSGRMKLMEDLVRFYEHFGLKTLTGDHPDHLCAELEFVHYLAFKEAAALARGEDGGDVRRAQRDFLDRHLCRWLPRVHNRLRSARDLPEFYLFAAGLAEEFCRRDLAWLKET
jgi:DMSO reductase family type II enzyme chaperone